MKFKQLFKTVFDFILPPQCAGCKELISTPHKLCGDCWQKLELISPPLCEVCGSPLDWSRSDNVNDQRRRCKPCSHIFLNFDKGKASLYYNEMAKKLIINFKHGDGTALAPLLADLLISSR